MDRVIEQKWYYEVGTQRLGPMAWEDLAQRARAGAFGPASRVWCEGWSDWLPAAQVPALFGAQTGAAAVSSDAVTRALVPVGRAPTAIIAGYLGLLAPTFFAAPFAVLFGVLALRALKRDPTLHGAGRAWFGIVMGSLVMIGAAFLHLAR